MNVTSLIEDFYMSVLNTFSFTVMEVQEMNVIISCIKEQYGKNHPMFFLKVDQGVSL